MGFHFWVAAFFIGIILASFSIENDLEINVFYRKHWALHCKHWPRVRARGKVNRVNKALYNLGCITHRTMRYTDRCVNLGLHNDRVTFISILLCKAFAD